MKKIILIQAHKNLELLNDLIDTLESDQHVIYVHVDKKSKMDINSINKKACLIKKRVRVEWGSFSQVQATINSLREIASKEKEYEHVIHISGQDYPVVSNDLIDRSLKPGRQYIRIWKIGKDEWDISHRYETYYLGAGNRQRQLASFLNQHLLINRKRILKIPMRIQPYGGSAWWMLTSEFVNYVLDFIEKEKKVLKFFRYAYQPDEMFFQTIIMNSSFASEVENNIFHYMDWDDGRGGVTASPKVLGIEDYKRILDSGSLFCRKIDPTQSSQLIEKLKENIHRT